MRSFLWHFGGKLTALQYCRSPDDGKLNVPNSYMCIFQSTLDVKSGSSVCLR